MDKKLVLPGEFISDDVERAGEGTFVDDGKVFSSVFGVASLKNQIKVVPLSGKYIPKSGDLILGIIKEITFSNWIVDIRSPYDGLLHISEYPRRIENTEMSRYLNVGDAIMTLVVDVDVNMKVELTLNDQRLRPVKEGRIVDVTPSKVPRFIGRSGSMIAMLKNETHCNIFIGQNGRIWITGKDRDMDLAVKAIKKIEKETHVSGLTDRITKFLKEIKGENVIEKEPDKEEKLRTEEKTEEEKTEMEKSGGILDELLGDEK
ncbi:MAG: S1 RNA-binding domain-containing protein [Candidatus Methanoperedens sp.]|nr:S1 RNA-binding domain-containing protein [Candidatus Methanoperedens sp.]